MKYYVKFDNGPEQNTQKAFKDPSIDPNMDGWIEIANQNDVEGFFKLENGVPVKIAEEEAIARLNQQQAELEIQRIRAYRNFLLSDSDWTQIESNPLSPEKRAEWATYRQALRDFPSTIENPLTITDADFPAKPN